jgi:isopentenyl diphosphate isomerase/L-lactate dehydrogenase-like FMN-dependent dehydrogenase
MDGTNKDKRNSYQIFLSYAREDREYVESLYDKLVNAGYKPWIDTKDILPGEKLEISIQRAI